VNRVQKLRKKAGLQATDDVDVFYAFEGDGGAEIVQAMDVHAALIERTVRSKPADAQRRPPNAEALIEEEQEIADVKFMLSLARR
jgi:isoleucyl-tRNA synthetase